MIRFSFIAMAVISAASAAAQEPVELRQSTWQGDLGAPLDQGVGDVSALDTNMRLIDPGLVSPMDFGDVYRVPGMPAMLMRIAGGVYAVFPQSVYSSAGAQIPPGTTFFIGGPPTLQPGDMLPQITLTGASQEMAELEAEALPPRLFVPPIDLGGGWSSAGAAPSIANSVLYRGQRLRQLMQQAADASAAGAVEVSSDKD